MRIRRLQSRHGAATDGSRKGSRKLRVHTTPAPVNDAPTDDEATAGVLAVVAKVSAYPPAALRPAMRLVDDLGFDSLMVGDLSAGLAERFPELGGIPQELLINGPTIADLIAYVRTGGAGPDGRSGRRGRSRRTGWRWRRRRFSSHRVSGPGGRS